MKNFTLSLLLAGGAFSTFAQNPYSEYAPVTGSSGNIPAGNRAMFDVQLDVAPTTIAAGLAGCYWTGTEFWVSRWANDSIFTVDGTGAETGNFTIAGVTGVRSITSDGTFMYLGTATNSIFKVDKTTHALLSTITSAAPNPARYVTYDPTLNAGAGGFWTGNFSTDWTAVSMTGSVLSTITAATHGLTAVYGLAYDNLSSGGPYLWAFDQGVAGDEATLYQLTIGGTQTGIIQNTQTLGGGNTGIAGGICVVNNFINGFISLGGLNQGASLFMYELGASSNVTEIASVATNLKVYPNPTNAQTTVSFGLTSSQEVKIEVYNVTGVMVYSTDLKMMTAGDHTVTLNSSNFESGMYTVKMVAGKETTTSQLSVIK
jgi:hypothetical protein